MLSDLSLTLRLDRWPLWADTKNKRMFHNLRTSMHQRRLKKTISRPISYREQRTDGHDASSWSEPPPDYGMKVKRRTIINRIRESVHRRRIESAVEYPVMRIAEQVIDDDASSWLGPPPGYEETEAIEATTLGRFRQSIVSARTGFTVIEDDAMSVSSESGSIDDAGETVSIPDCIVITSTTDLSSPLTGRAPSKIVKLSPRLRLTPDRVILAAVVLMVYHGAWVLLCY
jgi:hypothetical protein